MLARRTLLAAAELATGERVAARRTLAEAARACQDAGDPSYAQTLREAAQRLEQP